MNSNANPQHQKPTQPIGFRTSRASLLANELHWPTESSPHTSWRFQGTTPVFLDTRRPLLKFATHPLCNVGILFRHISRFRRIVSQIKQDTGLGGVFQLRPTSHVPSTTPLAGTHTHDPL